jgi:IstB-like ATP binding protein
MERSEILALMLRLKLFGMRAAYDEVMATALKRGYAPARVIGELLAAEITENQARSIKYQMTLAKLPLAKDLDGFAFAGTPINESLIRNLATGAFLTAQRNAVLVGERVPAHRTWRSPWPAPAFAVARAAASTASSISSTGSKARPAPAARAGLPTISPAWTSSCSTSSAICPSPRPVVSSSFI